MPKKKISMLLLIDPNGKATEVLEIHEMKRRGPYQMNLIKIIYVLAVQLHTQVI